MNDDVTLDPCACRTAAPLTPRVSNRPGLLELSYRVETHGTALRRMLAAIARPELVQDATAPGTLTDLGTRESDDPSIALLDSWAVIADVLTFYQERIANEGYLRTATERRSIVELARSIGYEPKPGVAASAYLQLVVDTSPGAPVTAGVPPGTRVQSLPAGGGLPQSYETESSFVAHADWNEVRPRLTHLPELVVETVDGTPKLRFRQDDTLSDATRLYFAGTTTGLRPGDLLLFALTDKDGNRQDPLPLAVRRVEVQPSFDRTQVDLEDAPLPPPPPSLTTISTIAPAFSLVAVALNGGTVQTQITGQQWHESDLMAYSEFQEWDRGQVVQYVRTKQYQALGKQILPTVPASTPTFGIFAFGDRLGFFGHNAPAWKALPIPEPPATNPWSDWDNTTSPTIWEDSSGSLRGSTAADIDVYLERDIPNLISGTWAVFESPAQGRRPFWVRNAVSTSVADFALSARVTGLDVVAPDENEPDKDANAFGFREATAYVRSIELQLAPLPIEATLGKGTPEQSQLTLDTMVVGLQVGQHVIITGERSDLPGVVVSEATTLRDVVHADGRTTLYFTSALEQAYARSTVTISANVVLATHGETVSDEVLGNGDGSIPNQRFALRRVPLTYTSAPPAGAASSLRVWVNGVRWDEAPRLFGLEPTSERYMVRIDDDGKTRIIFGDGIQGARLPTGVENVRARYRFGIGLAGLVPAKSLILMQQRPPGIRSVVNPLPSSGAADPESRDSARANAPLAVLTFDRIVSLADFEDFARAFPGVGKARARLDLDGTTPIIYIVIATADGEPVAVSAPLRNTLATAIAASRDPGGPNVMIETFERFFFEVHATLRLDPRRESGPVVQAVREALLRAFSFETRDFGQPVTAAEVITVMQRVPGVVAVDLDQLYRTLVDPAPGPTEQPRSVLSTDFQPTTTPFWQRLLLVNPVGIRLTAVTPSPA
jgi:hypothetical protein